MKLILALVVSGSVIHGCSQSPTPSPESASTPPASEPGPVAVLSTPARDIKLDGQVFVVTKGNGTVRLSLASVALYDAEAVKAALAKQEAETAILLAELANDNSEPAKFSREYLRSSHYALNGYPKELQYTKTDVDGLFSFSAKPGKYVIAALTSRDVGLFGERYTWLVPVTADGDKKVILANDNMAPDSDYRFGGIISIDKIRDYLTKRNVQFTRDELEKKERADREARRKADQELEIRNRAASEAILRADQDRRAAVLRYTANPGLAQREAMAAYPSLGVAGSPLNLEFIAREKKYRAEKTHFFLSPDWPMTLARECSDSLKP